MSSKYIKKYSIPPGFQSLLSEFTKEILRNQPKDIIDFGVEYFKCLQERLILDYPHRGQNIPCDFKPAIPALPAQLRNQVSSLKEESEPVSPPVQLETPPEIKQKEEAKKEEKKIIKEKEIKIEEANDQALKDKDKKTSGIQTLSSDKNNLYENCIDFNEKKEVLEKLKQNSEYEVEIDEYLKKYFEPNKDINNALILIQKVMMAYYNTKGTDKESEYDELNKELQGKIEELKSKCPLIEQDLDSMNIKDAINEFKKYEYYPRILKVFLYKLNHLNDDNNELLDEMTFFLFINNLKSLTSDDNPSKVLENKPYLEKYYNHNIQLLLPDIYSFVLGLNHYDESEIIDIFSSFSFRKRELCHKFYIFYNLKNYGRPVKKKAELLEKYIFISSPKQILEKMKSSTEENKQEVFGSITEKLQENYPKIWQYITRIVNIPVELVHSSFDIFMGFSTINRDIILNYLNLGEEYKDIYDILSKVEIDPTESNFATAMDKIYFELKNIPELNYKNFCIYRNKLFTIPDSIKDFIAKFENDDWASDEENLLKEYEQYNPLNLKGIYIYLLIKEMEDKKLSEFVKKIKLIKDKQESENQASMVEGLKDNFTLDSDEFIFFQKEYEKWKQNLDEYILEYFKKENDEQKKEYFMSLKDSPDKVLIYNCIKIENDFTEEGDYNKILEDYKQFVPGKNN